MDIGNLRHHGPLLRKPTSKRSMGTATQHLATRVSQLSSRCPLLPQGEGQLVTSPDCWNSEPWQTRILIVLLGTRGGRIMSPAFHPPTQTLAPKGFCIFITAYLVIFWFHDCGCKKTSHLGIGLPALFSDVALTAYLRVQRQH